jgi:stage 0 sporulation regulatory protein
LSQGESFLFDSKKSMLIEIQKKRELMIDLAQTKGISNDATIQCSQELDQLIYKYQTFFYEKKRTIDDGKRMINYVIYPSKKTIKSGSSS